MRLARAVIFASRYGAMPAAQCFAAATRLSELSEQRGVKDAILSHVEHRNDVRARRATTRTTVMPCGIFGLSARGE